MLTVDIETNLKHDTIWLACAEDVDTGELTDHTSPDTLQALVNEHSQIVTHNGIGFDIPVLERVWGLDFTGKEQLDTYVLSCLYSPAMQGGHSLSAWGGRLGFPKGDFTDFDGGLCDEMITYCRQDVRVTTKTYQRLDKLLTKDGFSQESRDLEHAVTKELVLQRQNGFKLDLGKANTLYSSLTFRMREIEQELQAVFPPIVSERWSEKTGKQLKDKVEVFNVGSRPQIVKRLQSVGVKFTKKTDGGGFKVDETILEDIEHPLAQLVGEYLLVQKRAAQVSSWLEAVQDDGRVRGRVVSSGAVTGRMSHIAPNMAQIPATQTVTEGMSTVQALKARLGGECRECWTVDEGNKLVGVDASGLELRMLAHYMQDEDYTLTILEGDIHTANQQAAGLETRSQAKTFIYAFLYGAGDEKIGSIAGKGAAHGKELKQNFLDNTPALKTLKELIIKVSAKGGTIPSLDGRRIRVSKEHTALNYLLQGGGAVFMKKALLIGVSRLRELQIPFKIVANVHDEFQVETPEAYAKAVGIAFKKAMQQAGVEMGLRCPMDGEYQIGDNWSETH